VITAQPSERPAGYCGCCGRPLPRRSTVAVSLDGAKQFCRFCAVRMEARDAAVEGA
jgi:hypothetical protein